jgi:hypothetical protein
MIAKGDFDKIDFFDCYLGEPSRTGDVVLVPVRHILLLPGHPLNQANSAMTIEKCALHFSGVRGWERRLRLYLGDPRDGRFGDERIEREGPLPTDHDVRSFYFEGMSESPPAFVSWHVEAGDCAIEV